MVFVTGIFPDDLKQCRLQFLRTEIKQNVETIGQSL